MAEKRTMIQQLHDQGVPVNVACRRLDLSRSTFYYRSRRSPDDPRLVERIQALARQRAAWGYRKVHR